MGVYRKICYIIEDIIVKLLGKNQPQAELRSKVEQYRSISEEQNLHNSVF
ncbi:hypothetical protein [Bacillus marasmi]|nr:hypothetical protein [Bacillus marasmi]